jgi:hypothetical protein
MGVAPEAIVEKKSGIDSKNIFSFLSLHHHILQINFYLFFSPGMRLMLLIEVAPEAMGGFLGNNQSLRYFL